jgi:DNA-binding GntR family transcriptional regulator
MADIATTPGDNTYHRLRTDILFGTLAPGEKLRFDALRNRYAVSVSTLREVLARLISDGMVKAENQRGFEVAPISAEEFRQIAEMRYLLEAHALKDSFQSGDLEWESRVIAAHHKLATIEARMLKGDMGDQTAWKRYDREFHHALISACGSKTLLDNYARTFDRFVRYQIIVLMFRGQAAAEEHRALLQCALDRDYAKAKELLEKHISACVDYTVENGCFDQEHGTEQLVERVAETVGELAYRRIRSDIIFGNAKPGQRLKLDQLKERYGASVSTLRENLTRLASEGFVVAEGQKGFQVSPVSATDLREIADLRLLLEGHALEQSFNAGDLDWEGQVVAAYHMLNQMEEKMRWGDHSESENWKRYDWEFHQALISACGSRVLTETHGAVFDKYLRYQMIALSYRGDIAAKEHKVLLELALARDSKKARDVLGRHIKGGVDHALQTGTIR